MADTVGTRELYDRWAPTYPPLAHNPLMRAEEAAMLAAWPEVAGCRVLDLACGTGRYASLLAANGATEIIAVDFSARMLQQFPRSVLHGPVSIARVRASMSSLPFRDEAFDVVVCGLALGHAPELLPCLKEISRVLGPGGILLYSDFHPEAARAGHRRSFKDVAAQTHVLPHYCHDVATQRQALLAAGLSPVTTREVRAGFELIEPFPRSEDFYRQWHGTAFVLVVRARKLAEERAC